MTTSETMHGWYSRTMDDKTGTALYRCPDGSTVEVTEVTATQRPFSAWPDNIYKGLVLKGGCVRGKPPRSHDFKEYER